MGASSTLNYTYDHSSAEHEISNPSLDQLSGLPANLIVSMIENSNSNSSHFEGKSNSLVSTSNSNVVITNLTEMMITKSEIDNTNLNYLLSDNKASESQYNQAWFTTKKDKVIYHKKGINAVLIRFITDRSLPVVT